MAREAGRVRGPKPIHSRIQEETKVIPERPRKTKDLLCFQKVRVLSAKVSLTA
jgi:hypothetical protein